MKYDVFISYSRKDFDEVSALIEMLKRELPGITFWFDVTGIESGDEFEDKIISAIDNSSFVLFALSANSLASQWTKDEVMYAKNTDKKIIPVLLEGAQLRGWFLFKFGRIDCIDSTDDIQKEKLLNNLSSWLGKNRNTKKTDVPKQSVSPSQSEITFQPEPLCPCGSGKLFKECHGRPTEKTWKVGDYYNVDGKEGVVFWVDEIGTHGKIVSMDESVLSWCTREEYDKKLPAGATDMCDGMKNLQAIMKIEGWRNKYPAFAWCEEHGTGWYLPAIEELKELLLNDSVHDRVNDTFFHMKSKTMARKGHPVATYWSSTEVRKLYAWDIFLSEGFPNYCKRIAALYVRAVCAF